MLSHDETMRLIALAQQGEETASSTLLTENAPLLKSIIKRYLGKHVEYDDLYQNCKHRTVEVDKKFFS